MILSPNDILHRGLTFLGITPGNRSVAWKRRQFGEAFGSDPETLADQWCDLCSHPIIGQLDPDLRMRETDKTLIGLKSFFIAHYFIWHYPRNSTTTANALTVNAKKCKGAPFLRWVRMIGALKAAKVFWPAELDDPNGPTNVITVDCTNYACTEKKHPNFNQDNSMFDKKSNGAGWKYEIGIATFSPQIVSIRGPYKASVHDITIWREFLKGRVPDGKVCIADRGYVSDKDGEWQKLSTPCLEDESDIANLKTRARLRLETFNGRLKNFKVLGHKFRHSADCHKMAFEAVLVTVQYQMDNGSPVYDV